MNSLQPEPMQLFTLQAKGNAKAKSRGHKDMKTRKTMLDKVTMTRITIVASNQN
jgi:hypothetical protein